MTSRVMTRMRVAPYSGLRATQDRQRQLNERTKYCRVCGSSETINRRGHDALLALTLPRFPESPEVFSALLRPGTVPFSPLQARLEVPKRQCHWSTTRTRCVAGQR